MGKKLKEDTASVLPCNATGGGIEGFDPIMKKSPLKRLRDIIPDIKPKNKKKDK